jgi:hypothetical protein
MAGFLHGATPYHKRMREPSASNAGKCAGRRRPLVSLGLGLLLGLRPAGPSTMRRTKGEFTETVGKPFNKPIMPNNSLRHSPFMDTYAPSTFLAAGYFPRFAANRADSMNAIGP